MGNGQTQPRAFGAGGDHRVENAVDHLGRNARPVIFHIDANGQPVAGRADGDLALRARAQGDHAALLGRLQGLHAVAHNVEQHLDQLLALAIQVGNGGVVVAQQRNAGRQLGSHQLPHVLHHLVNVEPAVLRQLIGPQQPVHQILQAIGLANDDLRVLAVIGRRQLHLQQLRRTADAAQRVLDFVGQAADQLAAGLLMGDLPLLAGDAQMPVQRLHFDQQAGLPCQAERCHGAVNRHRRFAAALQAELALDEAQRPRTGVRQARLEWHEVRNAFAQRLAQHHRPRDTQQPLGGGVEGHHIEPLVKHDHGSGQAIQDGLWLGAGAW